MFMRPPKFIDPDVVRKHIYYNPDNGQLMNLIATPRMAVGYIFTTKYENEYISVSIAGERYAAHRAAWVYMTGEQPLEIDHINRCKHDNRWKNLRSVTRRVNCLNRGYAPRCSKPPKETTWSQ